MTSSKETEMNQEITNNSEAENSNETMRYDQSGIDANIVRAVTEMGFENMTPIQQQAIPQLLAGKDIIGQAQTGTGKTAAFGIPLLQMLDPNNHDLQAVVLCPTRELAIQAAEEMRKFSKYLPGIKMVPIYGGQDIVRQIKALKGGAQVVVGTPGRVMDHMRRHTIKMNTVKMIVMDEADEMLNMGFREDMETILKEVPENHQTALFSATMPKAILDITHTYQKDAVLVKVAATELTIPSIKQYYYVVKNIYKEEVVCRLLELYNLKRSMIFCNTKRMVDELAESLKSRGYQAEGLHGDLTQKQRDFVMNRFRSGSVEVLIATDVAARGIDVDDVEAVFNYDVPQDIEYYVHRIGRTGRAGREGMSFTFAYGKDLYKIRDIERVCKSKMAEEPIPSAKDVNQKKALQLMQKASATAKAATLETLMDQIEEYLVEEGQDPLEFAAALLKLQLGESMKEIPVEAPRKPAYGDKRKSSYGDRKPSYGDRKPSYGDKKSSKGRFGKVEGDKSKSGKFTKYPGKKTVSKDVDKSDKIKVMPKDVSRDGKAREPRKARA